MNRSHPNVKARRGLLLAGAAGGAAAVALVALGGAGGATETARGGPVALHFATPWKTVSSTIPDYGLEFSHPVTLAAPGRTLVAGMLVDGAPVPGGLPPALADRLEVGSRRRANLGGIPAVAYTGHVQPGKREVAMYVIATDRGDLGMLCSEVKAGSAAERCGEIAQTIQIHGVDSLAPGADPQLDRRLDAALTSLVEARAVPTGLGASRRSWRAAAASQLAAADRKAVRALRHSDPEARDRDEVIGAVGALKAEAASLTLLEKRARAGTRGAYAGAAGSVERSGRPLLLAVRALKRAGFKGLPRLRPLQSPPLPQAPTSGATVVRGESEFPVDSIHEEGESLAAESPKSHRSIERIPSFDSGNLR